MKTVIYLDVLLLVNFLVAYFLLLASGILSAQRGRFGRMVMASGLAALSSLILFAPELPYPVQLLYKLGTAAVIVWTAFGYRPWWRYAAAVCWYTALNILLAGLAVLVIFKTGTPLVQTGNLALYLRVSPIVLLALSALCCLGVEVVLRIAHRPEQGPQTIGVEVELCGTAVCLRAMLDTGCHLKDPMTCLPVLLISYPGAKSRLPEPVCRFLDAWFAGHQNAEPPPQMRLRLIPCTTAAQKSLLPGFAVSGIGLITANGVLALGRTAVAFSPQPFGSNAYEALYGQDFL